MNSIFPPLRPRLRPRQILSKYSKRNPKRKMKWWLYVSFRWFIPRSFPRSQPRSQPRVNIYIKSGLINHYPTHFPFSIYRTLEQQKKRYTHDKSPVVYSLFHCIVESIPINDANEWLLGLFIILFILYSTHEVYNDSLGMRLPYEQ